MRSSLSRPLVVVLTAALGASSVSCKPGRAAEGLASAPSLDDALLGQSRCGVKQSSNKPLVIEWPAAERAALESRATRGLVAVRYSGCEMEVLTTCSATGNYEYVGLTQKTEGVRITNTDQLYAQLPIGAVGLEGKLERAGQLNVDMTIVGRREADKNTFSERDLDGRCDEATHVITGLTVGAFTFYTGKSASIGTGVNVGNVGAGVGSSTDQELLKTDGNVDSCAASTTGDDVAPEGCGALLRVEVVPIDRLFEPDTPQPTGPPTAEDEKVERQIRTARALTLAGTGGFAVGAGLSIAGYFMYTRNKTRLEAQNPSNVSPSFEISPDRGQFRSRARTGAALGWTGLGLAAISGALAVYGSKRYTTLQRKKKLRSSIEPTFSPTMAGLNLRGEF